MGTLLRGFAEGIGLADLSLLMRPQDVLSLSLTVARCLNVGVVMTRTGTHVDLLLVPPRHRGSTRRLAKSGVLLVGVVGPGTWHLCSVLLSPEILSFGLADGDILS